MAFVVTEACIKCKYTDCVEVCPVDCFHEGPNFLVIDPEEVHRLHTLCEPECPVKAIFSEDEVPAGQEEFKKINAELSKKWPVIAEKKPAPPDAEQWKAWPRRRSCSRPEKGTGPFGRNGGVRTPHPPYEFISLLVFR